MGEMNIDTTRMYCVRIKNEDYGRKWYNGKHGEVFVVTISDNPNAGYLVEPVGDRLRTIEKGHAELIGPVGDFTYGVESEVGHVIELAKSIAELRRDVNAITTNVQTFAETVTSADYKAGQALTTSAQFADRLDALGELYDTHADSIDMLTDDIVLLDERTQPLTREGVSELSVELSDAVLRKLSERVRLNDE